MTYTTPEPLSTFSADPQAGNMFRRAEAWLDSKGRWAWFATVIAGFVFVWPVGLAILAYMIWSNRMSRHSYASKSYRRSARFGSGVAMRSSGNTAFDAYKAETIERLEQEQEQFQAFLERLRAAKDKAEFDQFMQEKDDKAES